MFETYTILISCCVLAGTLWGAYRHSDTLHPLVFLLPAAAYFYVYVPLSLHWSGALRSFFQPDELSFIQGLNFACVAALAVGCVWGSKGRRREEERVDRHAAFASPAWKDRLYQLSLVLGGIGVALYAYGLWNAGGFVDAYSDVKGGGWAASGYVRDFQILVIPAIVLLYMSRQGRQWTHWRTGLLTLFSSPFLVHGLLSARRGPTFVGITTIVVGWYLTRHRRPRLWQMVAGGATVGLVLLALVAFRGQIHLGSDFFSEDGPAISTIVEESVERSGRASYENEFIYGGETALLARQQNDFYWGTRYLTYIFIRPIPSAFWPNKYRDVGMEEVLWNAGTVDRDVVDPVIQQLPKGAAPGFAGDLYVEFGWLAVLAAFGAGWLFAFLWRRNLIRGGFWRVIYVCALALSIYFISQTGEAIIHRFLEVFIPVGLAWYYLSYQHKRAIQKRCNRTGALSRAT